MGQSVFSNRSLHSIWSRWAAWLGIIALGLNVLVPIHLAFDLAEALGAPHGQRATAAGHGLEWRFFALLTGHIDLSGRPDRHREPRRAHCPVCSSLTVLSAFAPASGAALQKPLPVAAPVEAVRLSAEPGRAAALPYFSRAPPIS